MKWKIALDNGNVVGVVFIDFKKAFDCVSHSILYLKLQALGFSGSALVWIRDYLKDRKQFAVVNECKSQLNAVKCGIPQGSLLGPRLSPFNDLPDQIKEGEIDMYADDTTLFYIGPSVDVVCDALNRILGDVHNWCRNNKLTIDSGKSEVMVLNRNSFCDPPERVVQYTRTVTVRTDRTDRQQGYTVCKGCFTVRKSHLISGTWNIFMARVVIYGLSIHTDRTDR